MRQSVSFCASSFIRHGTASGPLTASFYTGAFLYGLTKSLALKMDVCLPLYSNYLLSSNLNTENLVSRDYLRNIPVEAGIVWKPNDRMQLQVDVARNVSPGFDDGDGSDLYHHGAFRRW